MKDRFIIKKRFNKMINYMVRRPKYATKIIKVFKRPNEYSFNELIEMCGDGKYNFTHILLGDNSRISVGGKKE